MLNAQQGGPHASRGFTLIEMSIVLVIIGLIIGGILKGQEIISSARSKAVVNQINALRSASGTYFDRYRSLPGDDVTAATRVDARLVAGNGDGRVGALTATEDTTPSTAANAGENYQYFKALAASNLIGGVEVGVVGTVGASGYGGGSSLPPSPISGAGVTIVYGTHVGEAAATTVTSHWYRVSKGIPNATLQAMSPRDLYGIDAQIDDGLPGSGQVRGSSVATCFAAGAGATYVLSDNVGCIGYFEAHK